MFQAGSTVARIGAELRTRLSLQRAVETGTYRGDTTRALATAFPDVVTIELSQQLHNAAAARLSDLSNVRALQGDSRDVLADIAKDGIPTLYFLDGHWSTGTTAGKDSECPVLDELAAIGAGVPEDCIIIDDARLFAAAPPPPHNAAQWPTLIEVFDTLRMAHPHHHVTLVADQIVAVPEPAKSIIDAYAQRYDSFLGSTKRLAVRGAMRLVVGRT
jgi:predicted O-methyltransferase YrrM